MNIFEFAMEKERYSQDFYLDLAVKTSDKGLAKIFNMLANEEEKHFETIEKMQSQTPKGIGDTDVLADAKDIFETMRESASKFNFNVTELELYKKAQGIEKQARDFYLQKADEVKISEQKDIFNKLAEEEKKHYFLLDNIIEFVSRPEQWLENAEFVHLEEY